MESSSAMSTAPSSLAGEGMLIEPKARETSLRESVSAVLSVNRIVDGNWSCRRWATAGQIISNWGKSDLDLVARLFLVSFSSRHRTGARCAVPVADGVNLEFYN